MASEQEQLRVTDFYTEIVLPALAERLDQAFPEFGWRRDARGWVATNEQHTHSRLGVRAERVIAHGPAPRGFLVHGGEPMLWTAYVSGGAVPRGKGFVRAVKEMAARAAVVCAPIERAAPPDRRADLLQDFFNLCERELVSDRGARARAYLDRRGFPLEALEALETSGLGLVPARAEARRALTRRGYEESEIEAAGILADSRWLGRLCGAWRNESGRIGTLWARTTADTGAAETRYLYLRGASRTNLPPHGLSDVLAASSGTRREVVLVEGFFDFHQLRARSVDNVVALGGTSMSSRSFERLGQFGVEAVVLCLDNDSAGRAATARAVEESARASRSLEVYVISPEHLGVAKDPDALVRALGVDGWRVLVKARECGIGWRARELVDEVGPNSASEYRREALARAGRWLGGLPPRLALEQEDAVRAVSERCGYTPEAVERAFRSRFWSLPLNRAQCEPSVPPAGLSLEL